MLPVEAGAPASTLPVEGGVVGERCRVRAAAHALRLWRPSWETVLVTASLVAPGLCDTLWRGDVIQTAGRGMDAVIQKARLERAPA